MLFPRGASLLFSPSSAPPRVDRRFAKANAEAEFFWTRREAAARAGPQGVPRPAHNAEKVRGELSRDQKARSVFKGRP